MESSRDLVMSSASPLRDRSNEVSQLSGSGAKSTRRSRRSRGGEEVEGGEKPAGDGTEIMSFDEMRKQLSLWQSKLTEMTAEQIEAERLRQDSTSLRSKLSSCEEEASDRARRLAQTRVQVQEQAKELADVREKLNQKFVELAREKEVSERQAQELKELSDALKDAERRCVALEVEVAALKAELTAERVQASRLKGSSAELEEELALAKQAAAEAEQQLQARGAQMAALQQQWEAQQGSSAELEEELAVAKQAAAEAEQQLQARDAQMAALQQQWEAQQAEVESEREARLVVAQKAEEDVLQQKEKADALERELAHERKASEVERSMVKELEARLSDAAEVEAERLQALEAQKAQTQALEAEIAQLRGELKGECELSSRQREELEALTSEAAGLSADMEAQTASLQRELEAERELVALQRGQIQELEAAVTEGKQSCTTLSSQHQDELKELESMLAEVRGTADMQREQADVMVQDLQAESAEVARLASLESSLRQALDGQCQQLAEAAREQVEMRGCLQKLEQAQSESQEREEELQMQLQGAAQASGAQAHVLRSEVNQLSDALQAAQEESRLWRERAEALVRRRRAAAAAASRWEGSDAAWDWLMEHGEGVQGIEEMPEGSELRLQNKELCLSVRQFKQDCELLEAENLSLKQALNIVEDDLDRVSDQHAQLMGHVNHRQKIRYTMKLKDEVNRLCAELKKARQRIVQLEVNKESESLFQALASVIGTSLTPERSSPAPASAKRRAGAVQTTPRPSTRPMNRRTPGSAGCAGLSCKSTSARGAMDDFEDQMRLDEAERRCELQQHALERISVDFQHLKALIERAVMLADTERRNGVDGGNFAALLQRLRDIIAANHRCSTATVEDQPEPDALEQLPVAATPIHGDDDDDELVPGDDVRYDSKPSEGEAF